jgi:hypothetical protein
VKISTFGLTLLTLIKMALNMKESITPELLFPHLLTALTLPYKNQKRVYSLATTTESQIICNSVFHDRHSHRISFLQMRNITAF